jgi:hypothetical protein
MKFRAWMIVSALTAALAGACSSDADAPAGDGDGSPNGATDAGGSGGQTSGGTAGTGTMIGIGGDNESAPVEQNLVSFRIEPEDALLEVVLGETVTQTYRAFGVIEGEDEERDITERTVFYVPDNYLVGVFPLDGGPTFTSRLPEEDDDPAQRGGKLTVRAQAANSDGSISEATTPLTVKLVGEMLGEGVPDDAAEHFEGDADDAFAPELVYPNDGVLLPPNLGSLEVHFRAGNAENSLYQVAFESDSTSLHYYTECTASASDYEDESCVLQLTGRDFEHIADSNKGSGQVELLVRGSNADGSFGESASFAVEFGAERVDGAVYYWSATQPPSVVRFDFGSGVGSPEVMIEPETIPDNNSCIGCHALSRQGDKLLFSLGNPTTGASLTFVNDLSLPIDDEDFFTFNGATAAEAPLIANGSFAPDGSQFVAAPARTYNAGAVDDYLLVFDGSDASEVLRIEGLPFEPSHPDWSPLGDEIAVTAIHDENAYTIAFNGGGISLVRREDGEWQADSTVEVLPAVEGKNRLNPAYLPDGSLLLYTEVDDAGYEGADENACVNGTANKSFCNGYSDPGGKTWAIAPEAGADPVFLANAAAPGVADDLFAPPQSTVSKTDLMDTFPKPTPFVSEHGGKQLFWFTVSSQRRAGLRKFFPNDSQIGEPDTQVLIWMFALDPEKVKNGEDGSYPGFFLPFQDMQTSNHTAQWTEEFVSDSPPPPPPTPPPPPPPPVPMQPPR